MEKVSSGKGSNFKNYRIRSEPQKKKIVPKKIEPKKKVFKKIVPKKINLKPIPWLVPEAIEAMEKHIKEYGDQPIKVLEFGSGGSSLWFLEFENVLLTSIEHQAVYANAVKKRLNTPSKQKRLLSLLSPRPYHKEALNKEINKVFGKEKFDLVLIDGRDRVKCAEVAKNLLAPEGMIMLDNSERKRYAPIFKMFKGWEMHYSIKKWQTTWWFCPFVKEDII